MLDALTIFFCGVGLLFFTGGSLGILRLPDVYTRLHMAGMLDTLGSLSLLIGLVIYGVSSESNNMGILVQLKVLLLWAFIMLTSPTATHSMVDAGMRAGIDPWIKPTQRGRSS